MMMPKLGKIGNHSMDEEDLRATSGTIKLQKNYLDCENFDALPMNFIPKSKEEFHKLDNCELCSQPFKMLVRNQHHCRRCAASVCE
jgi:hypothetical protein